MSYRTYPLNPSYRYRQGAISGLAPLDENWDDEDVKVGEMDEKKVPIADVEEVNNEPVTVSWDGPDDPANPQNFPVSKKWNIVGVCCALTINATFASSAPAITAQRLIEQFHITREVSDLVTSLFLFGYVMGPIFWGSGSEIFGRRNILWLSMSVYTILFLGQALATNIETVLVLRFFSGAFASAPLIVCGGIMADVWNATGRGYATSLFGGCVFLGPSLGPLVGGFVADNRNLGWEFIFWIMMLFAGVCTVYAFLCLPETYGPVILTRKAKRLRNGDPIRNANLISDHEKLDWSTKGLVDRALLRPWKIMASEPILILITIYMSVVYGLLYALFEAFPVIFIEKRGFTASQQGLIFIGLGIGSILTTICNLYLTSKVNKIIPKWKGFPPPEERLIAAMIGSIMLVVSTFWLGWTGNYPSIPWYVPAISTIFVGWAISSVFIAFIVYIVDTYLMLAASALASNTMIRSAVGAGFPLFTVQMYHKLGTNWASTLIGLICLLLSPMPFLFYKYGARIRQNSKYAPCLDLKIAKQIAEQEAADAKLDTAASEKVVTPAQMEEVMENKRFNRQSVNVALLDHIQDLTNTVSEVQYLLNEAVASQAQSARAQEELVETIRRLESRSTNSRRDSIYGIGQDPITPSSSTPAGMALPTIPEVYEVPLRAPAPTKRPTSREWSVHLGPIDLSQVTDLHGTALSFAQMTRQGRRISSRVKGRKGGANILILSWKTKEEARAFYEAWSDAPPPDYATLSIAPTF